MPGRARSSQDGSGAARASEPVSEAMPGVELEPEASEDAYEPADDLGELEPEDGDDYED